MANSPSSDPQQSGDDRQATVLVVDDDPTIQTMILDYFVDNNIRTLLASGREEMLRQVGAQEVNVVILDLRLGVQDGLDVLRELRSSSDVPVIIITGHRRDEIDRVVGLELGADDYVTKPFNLRELLARVRAILRRLDRARASPAREPEHGYRFSGWRLNLRTRRLADPTDADVTLTKGEYALLVAFLDAPQRPLSREHLLQANSSPRRRLRSQHRRPDSSSSPQTGRVPKNASDDPDRTRFRIWHSAISHRSQPRATIGIQRVADNPAGVPLTAPQVLAALQRVQGRLETATRMREAVGAVFRLAVATGRTKNDPTFALRGALARPTVMHRAVLLDPKAFGAMLRAVDGFQGQPTTRACLQTMALFFPRPGELLLAKWSANSSKCSGFRCGLRLAAQPAASAVRKASAGWRPDGSGSSEFRSDGSYPFVAREIAMT